MFFERFGRQILFSLDPERAHDLSIAAFKMGSCCCRVPNDPALVVTVAGLVFPNPLGMAAGYDKNAEIPDELLKLGFGFTEVGTLTPFAQPGNPRPRIFRLVEDRAIINRLGFNNKGYDAALQLLSQRTRKTGIVGVNIGANKETADRIADYVVGIQHFYPFASYFVANISSPNTPGLRDLQTRKNLRIFLSKILNARDEEAAKSKIRRPVFLKIAPDLIEKDLDKIAAEILAHPLDGLVISNTTLSRSNLKETKHVAETGGLSGTPLFERSTIILAKMRKRVGSTLPIIGVGGVDSVETALTKMRAGADLVQLYTGFIYHGPGLPRKIIRGLSTRLKRDGVKNIAQLRGSDTDIWAEKTIPD